MKRIVTIYSPQIGTVQLQVDAESPYDMVEQARTSWKSSSSQGESFFSDFQISDIVPIHNPNGIRDRSQVEQMLSGISSGRDISERDGFPNIKLVVVPEQKLLLFDGTHSLLAYFQAGKKFLNEVPFLVISAENKEPISSAEIAQFFPEETRDKVSQDWEKYVVNWQAEKGKQLEIREVGSIAQLAAKLSETDKSAVE